MKYLKLFENYNELNNLRLEDVIGSIEDYIYNTYNVDNSILDNPYGCESKEMLEDDINMDNLWDEYDINPEYNNYYETENFIRMMSDENCHVSLPYRFENIKKEFQNLGEPITVWRCMSVNREFIDNFLKGNIKNLGKYWTFSKNEIAAQMHKKLDYLIVFECNVDSKYVDFKRSILFNLNYYVGSTEKEIILKTDTVLKLKNVFVTNNVSNDRYFPFYDRKQYSILNIDNLTNINYHL